MATFVKSCETYDNNENTSHDNSSMIYGEQNSQNFVGSNGSQKSLNRYVCDICDYNTDRKNNYDKHLSSVKHVKKVAFNNSFFKCESCEYTTTVKSCYNKHLISIKHKMNLASIKSQKDYQYNCSICNYHTDKKYNYDKHIISKNHKVLQDDNDSNSISHDKNNVNMNDNKITINDDTVSSIMS